MQTKTAYLTGSTNRWAEDVAGVFWGDLGLLVQPGNSYHLKIDRFAFWAADNGCFSPSGKEFNAAEWWAWLEGLEAATSGLDWSRHELEGAGEEYNAASTCLFATAPDVVGDAEATLERSRPWLSKIRALGLPVAFVAQDGAELEPDRLIPWGEFDVLFLGGSTEWKEDPERAGLLTRLARERGIPVHMGRVNSARRFALAASWDCETADGTLLAFGSAQNIHRPIKWFDAENFGNRLSWLEWAKEEIELGRRHALDIAAPDVAA